ncbi:MAG: enoyl-ACP reductase FabI [Rhodospirillaceae bacterium]|nr:enoyl-ACP reductase FabI [Rhodospirillaceae bacterium]
MSGQPGILSGRRGLVMGVANERSIAWGIARQAAEQGAELAFTYQGGALEKRVRPLAESVDAKIIAPCDVTDPASMDALFEQVGNTWDRIDFVLHAVAFSDKAELNGRYADTTRENFLRTMDISCFSFTDVCRRAAPLMTEGGSLVTLSYYGAERVIPHYNVMGVAKAALEASVRYLATDLGRDNIRVNAISAGPMKTLAASGIGDFRYILKWNELNSPMRRNVTLDDVGRSGLYLISDLSSAVTGEVHHVDCGYHIVGMMAPESAQDISDLLDGAKLKD